MSRADLRSALKFVVGTHHKTGSKFFSKTLKSLKRLTGLRLWLDTKHGQRELRRPDRWDCYFQNNCNWRLDLDTLNFKGIHSTRNPARLILSSVRYHLRTDERWAHKPQQEFSGLTYAEKLRSLNSLDDQICFEMEHVAGRTIRRMLEVSADRRFLHVDLDHISADPAMEQLKACHRFCDLERWFALDTWLAACRPHCLWAMQSLPSHVTSGSSELADSLELFSPRARAAFRSSFGDPLHHQVFG